MENIFNSEKDFEDSLVDLLRNNGWKEILPSNLSEKELIDNWADILYRQNNTIDRLNGCPLTETEMEQVMDTIKSLKSPVAIHEFIIGGSTTIKRDNPDDEYHLGKSIALEFFSMNKIQGNTVYQIARQPRFASKSAVGHDRRGDVMLLINGMPLIHIELKKSGVAVGIAINQIETYVSEGVFTGLFSLVQIFVAMEPKETVYFANPGNVAFNKAFQFHWADFNNEPINEWDNIVRKLLSIPRAHQLIGYYSVADNTDGVLKVMRSYQCYAANMISDRVAKTNWNDVNLLGGYVWHTTGSGKTMTSFKSAQLIANSKNADKVVFVVDRNELGTQSLREYRNFANDNEEVQATEDTCVLISKLKSNNPSDTLIVTSIQKLGRLKEDSSLKAKDLETIISKRVVFIVDEAHRSTFGEMLANIKQTFTKAIFFGFTGTPILEENMKEDNTTATIFGDELHRYSIVDGIRDKNVLGFNLYKVLTYKDMEVREKVALYKAHAKSYDEIKGNKEKEDIYNYYKDPSKVKMYGYYKEDGTYQEGIEDSIDKSQYQTKEHQEAVVDDIIENRRYLSRNGKFHAIFATSSIPEAIEYYRLFKEKAPELKVTALFDKNTDYSDKNIMFKTEGLEEIITDYNNRYFNGKNQYTMASMDKMKKDISARLAHKKPYLNLSEDGRIDILIVVEQMLTGFDSKWINALYLDKIIKYENIIQAFSRTNRVFGNDKPFGTIKYYRKPHTMEQNVKKAVKLYSGDKPFGLFVPHLLEHLKDLNRVYEKIQKIFDLEGIKNFTSVPKSDASKRKFISKFNELQRILDSVIAQGFKWDILVYYEGNEKVEVLLNKNTYLVLLLRYKEVASKNDSSSGENTTVSVPPFDIESYITSIDTGIIDAEYMNSNFTKYLRLLESGADNNEINKVLEELHSSFSTLTEEEQKYANIFLNDIERGEVKVEPDKTFKDYIYEYMANAKNDRIHIFATTFGFDEELLKEIIKSNKNNINEYGRLNDLKKTIDPIKAKKYLEETEKTVILPHQVNIKIDKLLREFISTGGGFEIQKFE